MSMYRAAEAMGADTVVGTTHRLVEQDAWRRVQEDMPDMPMHLKASRKDWFAQAAGEPGAGDTGPVVADKLEELSQQERMKYAQNMEERRKSDKIAELKALLSLPESAVDIENLPEKKKE